MRRRGRGRTEPDVGEPNVGEMGIGEPDVGEMGIGRS